MSERECGQFVKDAVMHVQSNLDKNCNYSVFLLKYHHQFGGILWGCACIEVFLIHSYIFHDAAWQTCRIYGVALGIFAAIQGIRFP
jgi:hypothetical protein